MDIVNTTEAIAKHVDKEKVKNAVNQALDTKAADAVIDKVNDKTKNVDITKENVKTAVNTLLK